MKLSDLKSLIKESMKEVPRMSSGKQALYSYAEKKGLFAKPESTPVEAKEVKLPAKGKAPVEAPVLKKGKVEVLPDILKAKVSKKVKVEALPDILKKGSKEVPVRKASPFAEFMKTNRGSGKSMAELSAMYRESKS